MVVLLRVAWVGEMVLRDRLHGPVDGMAGVVFRDGVEEDFRRVAADGDFAGVLQAGRRGGWPFQAHGATGILTDNGEGVVAVVERGRRALPVLLILIALGQRPDFVTAIVNPAAGCFFGGNVFALVDGVHEE